MAESIRELIIQNIVARVKQVLTGNAYNSDVGANAVRATKYADVKATERAVIIPRIESAVKTRYKKSTLTFPVDIHAFVRITPGTDNASVASEAIYADLIRAITRQDTPVSILMDSVTHTGGGGVELTDNESTLAGATATFDIIYTTALGDPSAQ